MLIARATTFILGLAVISVLPQSSSTAESKFRFGVSAPLSGVLAEYGSALRNGLTMAQDDMPAQFKHIDITLEDSQWDPKTAVSVFNALHRVKGSQLIYSWGNPPNTAVAPVAEQLKVPTLAMSSDQSISKDRNWIIRTVRGGEQFGETLAKSILIGRSKRYGIALAEVSYLQGIYKGFEKYAMGHGANVELLGTFDPSIQDFRSVVALAKSRHYDSIGVLLITGQVQSFYKQMRDQKYTVPTFGGDFLGSETEIAASGSAIDGAIFPDLAVTPEFRTRYKERFGNDIQIAFGANAYDIALLVAKNFGYAGASNLSNAAIMERLRAADPIVGAHRSFRYENDPAYGPAFVSPLVVRRVQHGEIEDIAADFE